MKVRTIHNRRELFFDDLFIDKMTNLQRIVHTPAAQPAEPCQPRGYYMTMLQHKGTIHCYYRDKFDFLTGHHPEFSVKPGFIGEYTAYAQSLYGIKFMKPPLFLYDCGVPNVLYCMAKGYTISARSMMKTRHVPRIRNSKRLPVSVTSAGFMDLLHRMPSISK